MAASTGRDGFNTPFSRTTTAGKFEASYQLPAALRLIGSVEVDAAQALGAGRSVRRAGA